MLVGDFNGDGIPDLAINCNPVVIYLGKAVGTYTEAPVPSVQGPTEGPMVIADFNGDGIPDLAVIMYGSADISILLGKGDGTFAAAIEATAPGGPVVDLSQIVTADFNGDGIPDLAVIDSDGSTVDILLGNGDGTFTSEATNPPTSGTPQSIVTGDFNGDGKTDLAVAESGDSIAILSGNGDGTFAAAGTVHSGSNYSPIAAADFNGDGKLDLAVAEGGAPATRESVTILTGNGDGTFNSPTSGQSPVSTQVTSIVVADFNQDGAADVVVTDQNGNATVFLNDGSGTFSESYPVLTVSPSFYLFAGVGDLNGDGYPDIMAAGYYQSALSLLLTEPTETATATANVAVSGVGQHLVDASYSGDSNYNASVSGTTFLWGLPPTTTTTLTMSSGGAPVTSVPSGSVVVLTATVQAGAIPVTAGTVNFCDASASTCTDIHLLETVHLTSSGTATFKFVPGPGAHNYRAVFVEDGYGLSSSSSVLTLTVGAQPVVYADTTAISEGGSPGDYSLTATVVGYGGSAPPTGSVSFLDTSFGNTLLGTASLGQSTAGRGWLVTQTPALSNAPASEVAGDFNGDGIPDLALLWSSNPYSEGPFSVTIFFGKGDGTFTSGPTVQATGVQSYPKMIGGDFNGDGKTDLAVLSYDGSSISYITTLLGNGDGTFGTPQTGQAYNQGSVGGDVILGNMVAADFNGDGKMDLAIVGDYVNSGGVTILRGNGDGTFTAAGPNLDPSADFGVIATGDFNGDGIPDLVVTNYFTFGGSPTIFLGKGDGTFTATAMSLTLDYFPTSIVVGDFNGDGILDLAFSDLNGVEIALGYGDGTFKETPASPIQVPSELYSLTAGDFNQDGKLDLAGIDNYNDRIVLLVGAGDGTFAVTATNTVVSAGFIGPFAIVAGDFNEDGVPDLAMLTQYVDTASILLNESTQSATATVNGLAPVGAGTHNVDASYSGDSNYNSSVSGIIALTAGLAPLVISPAAGTYSTEQTVTISESVPGATIYYTASGTVNTAGYVPYTGPIQLTEGGSEAITAYATETGYQQTNNTSATYKINLPPAPAPLFSLATGYYAGAQTVTISDPVSGANIFYTTNGQTPTQFSTAYTGPITVSASETLAAVVMVAGYSTSPVTTAQYFIGSSSTSFIYTVAGNESMGYAGDGGPATVASLNRPWATAVDGKGNLFIADAYNNLVRRVDAGTGIITTVAGTGVYGYTGDNGPATSATISGPSSVAIDNAGNLYISDEGNNVIRKVAATTGTMTTFAGSSTATVLGDNGPATAAQITGPTGIAFDGAGNLYISTLVNRVREVNANTGVITTVAGSSYGYAGDNGPATLASLGQVEGVAVDKSGNIYIADSSNQVIRKVTASTGIITTIAGKWPTSWGFSGDGGPATSAQLNEPYGVAVDGAGNVYIADSGNEAVREVMAGTGIINSIAGAPPRSTVTLSGDGGPANASGLSQPIGVTADAAGNLYIAETDANRVRKVTAANAPPATAATAPAFSVAAGTYVNPQTVVLSDSTPGAAIYITLNGTLPTTTGAGYHGPISVTGSATLQAIAVAPGYLPSAAASATYTITTPPPSLISTVAGTGVSSAQAGGAATSAQLGLPYDVALDANGNMYIADAYNQVVWKVLASNGTTSVFAGTPGAPGQGGDGVPATQSALLSPSHVAFDAAGNLYISDSASGEVRKVSAQTGIISTYAGGLNNNSVGDGGPATSANIDSPQGIAFDGSDNLYIADEGHNSIRKVTASTGIITTFAGVSSWGSSGVIGDGGPATSASLYYPYDVAFDNQGNLFIADMYHGRVRMVAAGTGVITTVAGNGLMGMTGDGGPATSAEVNPEGLAIDSGGNIYISNWPNTIRKVPAGGGVITTIAGDGYSGYYGDGGSATIAGLSAPSGLTFDKSGNLYIADLSNYSIRKVVFPGPAATPAFSLAAGLYRSVQTVAITDATQGAVIYYTTDGSTPSTGSSVYGGPVTVSSTETILAIAVATGYVESAAATAAYTINLPVTPTITWPTPAAITFGTALSAIQLNATASVPGTFTYNPAAGTIPAAGSDTLSVTFTPTDSIDYTTATTKVTLIVNNSAVVIGGISPAFTSAGSGAFTVTVNGLGFQSTSTVYWGTTALTTQFVSATQLIAQVPATDIATAGITAITVQSPAPGGGTSNSLQFEVDSALSGGATPPTFTPQTATVAAGATASYSVTLPSSATNISVTCLNLPGGATCSYSASAGAVTITTAPTTPAGTYQVTVVFTETLPGAAAAFVFLPILILPLILARRRWAASRIGSIVCLGFVLVVAMTAIGGCGGGSSSNTTPASHQATSSGVVSITVH